LIQKAVDKVKQKRRKKMAKYRLSPKMDPTSFVLDFVADQLDKDSLEYHVTKGAALGSNAGLFFGPYGTIAAIAIGAAAGAAWYGVDLVQSEMELKEKLEEIGIRNLSMKGLEILEEKTLGSLAKAKWNDNFKKENILSADVKTVPPSAYQTKLGLIRSAKAALEKDTLLGGYTPSITTSTDSTFNPDLTDIQFGTDYRTPDFGLMNDEMQIGLSNFDAVAQFNSAVDQMQAQGVLSGTPYDYNPDQPAYSVSIDLNMEPANYGYNEFVDTNLSQATVSIDDPHDGGYGQTGGTGASTDDPVTDEEMDDYEQMNDDWGYF
jgi:hypothetical protein